jgi:hypothetical protein
MDRHATLQHTKYQQMISRAAPIFVCCCVVGRFGPCKKFKLLCCLVAEAGHALPRIRACSQPRDGRTDGGPISTDTIITTSSISNVHVMPEKWYNNFVVQQFEVDELITKVDLLHPE